MSILSGALIAGFSLLALSHLVMAYFRIVRRRSGFSSVPLINGLIGAAGFGLSPVPVISGLWWLPFLVDWGCTPLAVEILVWRSLQDHEDTPTE